MKKGSRIAALGCLLGALASPFVVGPALAESDQTAKVPVADLAEASKAQQALEGFIRSYESGNIELLRTKLDPAMIGYQRFIDGMIADAARMKMIRINLLDTQSVVGPDVAMIQTSWEKRFLTTTGLTPSMYTGRSQFLMHRDQDGWRLAAVGGDNPFASQSGVLAQLSIARAGSAAAPAFVASVVDPDVAGQGFVDVQVSSSNGTSMQRLRETTPGRFEAAIPGSGTVILRYMDANPGGGRPPSLLTKSAILIWSDAGVIPTPTPVPTPNPDPTPTPTPVPTGVLAQLSIIHIPSAAVPLFKVVVTDTDLAGSGHVQAQVTTSAGTATITLSETSPGRFESAQLAGSGSVTVRYLDPNPGGGQPPQLVTRTFML